MAPCLCVRGYGPELSAAERARQQLSVAGVRLGDATASGLICNPRDDAHRATPLEPSVPTHASPHAATRR